jgi:hypothetical protein
MLRQPCQRKVAGHEYKDMSCCWADATCPGELPFPLSTVSSMSTQQDYSKLSLPELLKEEKKRKRNEIFAALVIGFLVGVMVFGVVRKGVGFLYIAIPLAMIVGIYRNSQRQKQVLQQIRAEISLRNRA